MTDVADLMLDMGRRARAAADALRATTPTARTEALTRLAEGLRAAEAEILAANGRDIENARASGLSEALIARLALTPARVEGMAVAVETIAAQPDPVGAEGDFRRGDMVQVLLRGDDGERRIARGISQYSALDVRRIARRHSRDIEAILGYNYGGNVIHRDDLVLL